MLGLTNLGVIHTAISLVALAAAVVCFVRFGGIWLTTGAGRAYFWLTVLTCLTVFFHMIPAIAEGGTRLPPGNPWLNHPEAPAALAATGVCFVVFLAGAGYQVRRLRGGR